MKAEFRTTQVRQANKVLLALLKTPKTRPGLIAAVSSDSISRNFVFGWLIEQVRSGVVVKLKSSHHITYQVAVTLSEEQPRAGMFPNWLEPRILPVLATRRVYIDGLLINTDEEEK